MTTWAYRHGTGGDNVPLRSWMRRAVDPLRSGMIFYLDISFPANWFPEAINDSIRVTNPSIVGFLFYSTLLSFLQWTINAISPSHHRVNDTPCWIFGFFCSNLSLTLTYVPLVTPRVSLLSDFIVVLTRFESQARAARCNCSISWLSMSALPQNRAFLAIRNTATLWPSAIVKE